MFGSRDEYKKILGGKILGKDNCPFCENTSNYNNEGLIWEGKFWKIFYNKFPYTGNSMHILLVPRNHKKFFTDITSEEFTEMSKVHKVIKNFFGNESYFSFTRETLTGDTRSVEHLHMHFCAGVMQGKYVRKMLEKQGFPIKQDLNIDN